MSLIDLDDLNPNDGSSDTESSTPFIDLSDLKIDDGRTETPSASEVNLSLSKLVSVKTPEVSPAVTQNQLKNTPEIKAPTFSLEETLIKAQLSFAETIAKNQPILEATVANQTALTEAQQNSTNVINSTTSYIGEKLEKIENVTTKSTDEVKQIISGKSEKSTDQTKPVNKQLTQTSEVKVDSTKGFMEEMNSFIDKMVLPAASSIIPENKEATPEVKSTTLVNNQETTVDKTAQNVSNLSNTVSSFATNMINGVPTDKTLPNSPLVLAEPKRDLLSMTKEAIKPDLSGQTLSAIRQMADNNQILNNSINNLSTNKSEYNNTVVNNAETQAVTGEAGAESKANTTVINGGKADTSSVYLMQMLNFIKSGQLKVKIQ
jgi:hypothetical protein